MFVARDLNSLTSDQRALLLDVGQFTLDIIGMFEPTPFADLTSGVISLMRGDLTSAAISAVSVVPYIGDVAKLGKIPKYVGIVEKAIQVARVDSRFGAMLRPLLGKLLAALDRIPVDRLAPLLRQSLERMRGAIGSFLPGGVRVASRIDQLTDDMLRRVFGSTQNIGTQQRTNVRTVVEFFDKHNVEGKNPAEWAKLLKGIDVHSIQPISVVHFRIGDLVGQYVELSRAPGRQIGQWMTLAQGAVSHRNLGLSGHGRVRKIYRIKVKAGTNAVETVEMLKSKAAAAADHWTTSGPKPHKAITSEDGKLIRKPAEQVSGGGDQYFLPKAWEWLEEIPAEALGRGASR